MGTWSLVVRGVTCLGGGSGRNEGTVVEKNLPFWVAILLLDCVRELV